MRRKIYQDLLKWKNSNTNKPLMIIGSRQVGKTYIVKEFCKNEYDNHVYINLFDHQEIVSLFKEALSTEGKYKRMKMILKLDIDPEKTIIFFDEIQESEELISALKYFCESETPYKIICAGSLLGVKLKRLHASFPVGKVEVLYMFPLTFEEFLMAKNMDNYVDLIKECFNNNSPMSEAIHEELLFLYKSYLYVGGFPECVKNYIQNNGDLLNFDKNIIEGIFNQYLNDMNKYVINKSESIKIEKLYKSIPIQLGNDSKKFQFSKISNDARRREYETSLSWLLSSTMVLKSDLLKKVEIPPLGFIDDEIFKLYINDLGILISMLKINYQDILFNTVGQYKGVITENYVATELNSNGIPLIYYRSNSGYEIDFLLYNKDGIIPVEVKSAEHTQSKSLNAFMKKYSSKYGLRISSKNFGLSNNIKSIPLYATFLIK